MEERLRLYIDRLDKKLKVSYDKSKHQLCFVIDEELCVYYKQRNYTLNFLSNISHSVFTKKVNVRLDLSECPNISASALVMLFAEVSRARMVFRCDDVVTIDFPLENLDLQWKEAISVSYRNYASLFDNDHTFQTVSDPNKAIVSILKLMHKSGVALNKPDTRAFTKGVTEAMLNVINHAYYDQENPLDGIGRRWWQACWIQEQEQNNENILVYIIYDLGCGMLQSLPAGKNEPTSEHITRAMSYGVTRTGDLDRGKGTRNMEEATDIRDNSTMFIGTNSAVYSKIEGKLAKSEENLLSFDGTLVEWQIRL